MTVFTMFCSLQGWLISRETYLQYLYMKDVPESSLLICIHLVICSFAPMSFLRIITKKGTHPIQSSQRRSCLLVEIPIIYSRKILSFQNVKKYGILLKKFYIFNKNKRITEGNFRTKWYIKYFFCIVHVHVPTEQHETGNCQYDGTVIVWGGVCVNRTLYKTFFFQIWHLRVVTFYLKVQISPVVSRILICLFFENCRRRRQERLRYSRIRPRSFNVRSSEINNSK